MFDDEIHHSHDKLFKAGFSDPANTAALLQAELAPALAKQIDWSQLKLQPGSFIDSQFRTSESDLLFSASLAGRDSLIYILFEHQSKPDPLIALRLLRYMVRIWEKFATSHPTGLIRPLPVILPLVLAQNAEVWNIGPRFSHLLDIPPELAEDLCPSIPDFVFRLLQLAEMSFDDIRGTPTGVLILRTMKAERLAKLLDSPIWDESLLVQIPRETFELLLRYILSADIDKSAFENRIKAIADPQTRTSAMTLAQQYRQEGRTEGRQEGHQRGRQEDVLEALQLRFGHVPEGLKDAVYAVSDNEALRKLLHASIQCDSLEQFTTAL